MPDVVSIHSPVPPSKVEGARIVCCVCGARPFPEISLPEVVRSGFDLVKLDGQGRPSDQGRGFCSRHFKRLGGDRYEIVGGEQ